MSVYEVTQPFAKYAVHRGLKIKGPAGNSVESLTRD